MHTRGCAPAHACTPVFFGMEGMEGMEQPASMRVSGSIPRCHTFEVWKVSRSLRDEMPVVTAFIDDLRAAFGRDQVDGVIREGLRGRKCFWASENGNELGTWWPAIGERDGTKGDGRS